MTVQLLGVSHRTADTDLRGRLALADADLPSLLPRFRQVADEVVVLSTCNRTEVYAWASDDVAPSLAEALSTYARVPLDDVRRASYSSSGEAAVRHLFGVASGLDSLILGEPQILGQVRAAWEAARAAGATGPALNTLFRYAIEAGKEVRSRTVISRGATSIAHAAVELARKELGALGDKTVLVLGAGETGRLAALNLRSAGVGALKIANRTPARAQELAVGLPGTEVVPLSGLPHALSDADMLIACSSSPIPLVTETMLRSAMRQRPHKPLLVMDIAVPRNVETGAQDTPGVRLYDMDALQAVCAQNRHARSMAARRAEGNIAAWTERYARWQRGREAVPFVTRLHTQAEDARREETAKALRALPNLSETEREAVEALSRALLGRVLHTPTVWLRERSSQEQRRWLEEMWELGPERQARKGAPRADQD